MSSGTPSQSTPCKRSLGHWSYDWPLNSLEVLLTRRKTGCCKIETNLAGIYLAATMDWWEGHCSGRHSGEPHESRLGCKRSSRGWQCITAFLHIQDGQVRWARRHCFPSTSCRHLRSVQTSGATSGRWARRRRSQSGRGLGSCWWGTMWPCRPEGRQLLPLLKSMETFTKKQLIAWKRMVD